MNRRPRRTFEIAPEPGSDDDDFLPVRPTVSCAFDGQCAAATARRAVRTQQRGSQHVARACTQLRRVVSAHRGVQPADAQNGHFR